MGQEMSESTDFARRDAGISAFAEVCARMDAVQRLVVAIGACHPRDAAQVMAAALEDMSAGMPDVSQGFFGAMRADAEFWSDLATPPEIEAYVAAGLRVIERSAFCARARKRLFAALWASFPDADRRAFLARVDPPGKFRGRTV